MFFFGGIRDTETRPPHTTALWASWAWTCLWQVSLSRRRHCPTIAPRRTKYIWRTVNDLSMTSLWCRRQQVSAAARSKVACGRVPCNLRRAGRKQLLTWNRPLLSAGRYISIIAQVDREGSDRTTQIALRAEMWWSMADDDERSAAYVANRDDASYTLANTWHIVSWVYNYR